MANLPKARDYEEWVLRKVQVKSGKRGLIVCRTPGLLRTPKYLELTPEVAEKALTTLREKGRIACTNGIWWQRS